MRTEVNIDDHTWIVELHEDQLRFYYQKIVKENDDPCWSKFDGTDDFDMVEYTIMDDGVLPDGVSVFKVMTKITNACISLLNRSKADFFYFSASTKRKGSFYTNAMDKFVRRIGGNWTYQSIDNSWFYITKINDSN